jgi:signal transduction histidine kinase
VTLVPRKIRARVTAVAAIGVAAVLCAVGFGLVVNHRRALTETLDDQLEARADAIEESVTAGEPPELDHLGDEDWVAQVAAPGGSVVASSSAIVGTPALNAPIDSGESVRSIGAVAGGDDPLRLLSRVVDAPNGTVIVNVAAPTDDIDESTRTLVASLLLAVPLATAVLAGLTWLLVGRTLRPVERIRAEVAAIGGAELHRRVPVPPADDEIGRLARTMNGMLTRIEDAATRQRRFVADASHELRSPLTRMRTELEVDETHPATADPAVTRRSVLDEVIGLQRLVDDLLLLARADAPSTVRAADRVDLGAVVRDAVDRSQRREGVAVNVTTDGVVATLGNAAELARAIGNVIDNAVRHARTTVAVAIVGRDGRVVVSVTDDGSGIPADEQERIFERFARVDEARSADAGGAGLGLSIAREIIQRHGGAITVETARSGGARFVIGLPADFASRELADPG